LPGAGGCPAWREAVTRKAAPIPKLNLALNINYSSQNLGAKLPLDNAQARTRSGLRHFRLQMQRGLLTKKRRFSDGFLDTARQVRGP
jgi:hypothetical protein